MLTSNNDVILKLQSVIVWDYRQKSPWSDFRYHRQFSSCIGLRISRRSHMIGLQIWKGGSWTLCRAQLLSALGIPDQQAPLFGGIDQNQKDMWFHSLEHVDTSSPIQIGRILVHIPCRRFFYNLPSLECLYLRAPLPPLIDRHHVCLIRWGYEKGIP